MANNVIKSGLWALAVGALALGTSIQPAAAQNRKADKQRAQVLSYQRAAGGVDKKQKSTEWVDPNATVVRGTPRSKLSPAEQLAYSFNERKAELQKQVDLLGAELKTARGAKARKITKEMEVLADQIAVIDRKLAALPKTSSETSGGTTYTQSVDSLGDLRMEKEGYVKGTSRTPVADSSPASNLTVQAQQFKVVYRVQLAVTMLPNDAAFTALAGVKVVRRPDGRYAYYYGEFSNYTDAQAACKRLRANPKYRDAFVIATRGNERISIQEAARLLSTMR